MEKFIVKFVIVLEKVVIEDKVYCLCCGKGFIMFKCYLKVEYGLIEDEYCKMFGLFEDFFLVVFKYLECKVVYVKKVGLGKYSCDVDVDQGVVVC